MQTAHSSSISSFNASPDFSGKTGIAIGAKLKLIIKSIVFVILLLSVVLFLEYVLQTPGSVAERKNAIAKLEKNSIDVMFIGNSHAYCTFDPDVIEETLDKRVFNAGLPDQKIDTTYYTFKEMLENQNPEIVVFETFAFGRTNARYSGYVANVDAMTPGLEKIKACFEIFPDKLEALRMSTRLYRCHNNWKKPSIIKKNLLEMLGHSPESGIKKGFYVLKSRMSEASIKQYRDSKDLKYTAEIDEYSIGWFKRIVDLCEKRGIRLIAVTAPFNSIYLEKVEYGRVYEKLKSICGEAGVEYVDFNLLYDEIGLDFSDFEDAYSNAQHTNIYGAEKVSRYFAKYLEQ